VKRFVLATIVLLCTSAIGFAQQDPADSPATKEDVQKYLEVMHSREMMSKMMDAMMKPMHQMMHERYEKDKDKLPTDFEARMNKELDDYVKSFPWDEMLQAMVPVYQKHFLFGPHWAEGLARASCHHSGSNAIHLADHDAED